MNNLYGIKGIKAKHILLQSPSMDCTYELNAFLSEHNGNIIDVQITAQALGQVFALVVYREG